MEEIPRPGSADTYMDTSSAQITSSGETVAVDLSKPLVSNQTTDQQLPSAEDLSAQKAMDIAVETPMECDTASISPAAESQVDPTRFSNPAEEGASSSAEVKAGELNFGSGGADSDVKASEPPVSTTASVAETAILAPASTVATSAADIEMSDATLPRPDIKADALENKITTIASTTMQTIIPPATTPAAAKPKSLFASLFPPTPKPPTPPVQPVNVSTASLPKATSSALETIPSPATPAYPTPVVAHVTEAVQMPAEPGNAPDIKPIPVAKPVSPAVATDAAPITSVSVSVSAEVPASTVAAFPVSSSGEKSSESEPPKNADNPPITEAAPPVVVPVVSSKMDTITTGPPVVVKLEVKQPPPGGKTMKRESRKGSTASPTGSTGEVKKKSKAGSPGGKTKKKQLPPKEDGHDGRNDFYCWICHKEGEVLCCELCPRVFHAKCLHMTVEPEGDWFCPECEKITDAECKETQSRAMSMLTIDQFSLLLKYVIQRMKLPMSEAFHDPVDTKMFPDYPDYVFHPMDLSTIEKNIKKRKYGCPEAFVAEFKWVVHNCVIYNSPQSKLTQTAKAMLKVAERELGEIEVCPECYLNSCRKRENWFCEPCKELHPLVWAKLQGFPHWPAKALRIEKGQVDVRFFGQHDRAWIPISGCYLISKELPLPVKNKKKGKGPGMRGGLDNAMLEMQGYIENIKRITGEFEYAPPRTGLTHCDLYRRSGTLSMRKGPGGKQPEANKPKSDMVSEGKGSAKMEGGNDKAKIELKDIASGKDLAKQQILTSLTPKKAKLVTTSGEHPARPFATKKKKAAMESLKKTIESCKASLGIENLQDVKMNSGSEETSSSSSDEENEGEENKEETQGAVDKEQKDVPSTSGLSAKPATEEDDSDAELVIDLGDMDESADTTETKQADKADAGAAKTDEIAAKKRKTEASEGQGSGKPLKSILVTAPKLSERDERKKMLAKALSEKIATGKRKHDVDGTTSGTSPSTKMRKTQDPHEKLGIMKEKKKSHHGKDISGKPKGILKPSDPGMLRKEGHGGSEKRPSDPLKHKHKDGRDLQKNLSKKQPMPPDKPGRKDKVTIPTGADARKLFNGGRIPRKNPITSDEEPGEKEQEDQIVDQTPDVVTRRRSSERVQPLRNASSINGINRRTSLDGPKRTDEENITFASLKKYSDKVMDSVQKVFYEMYTDMMVPLRANASPEKQDPNTASAMHQVAQMRLELERLKWMHEQEIAELKHNHDLTVAEIRQSLENEKKQLLLDARLQAETEKNRAVDEAKRKQWCAYCNKEAIFYCCWNTSYCDYPCQQRHWAQHVKSCAQAKASGGASATPAITESKTPASAKPLSLPSSTSSIGKTTLTLSGVGSLSKPATSTKSMVVLPSSLIISKQTPASVAKGVAKIPTTSSEKVLKVSIPAPAESSEPKAAGPQISGISISAISARLLAAKQKTTPAESTPGKVETAKTDTTTPPASAAMSSDHVKTTLDSPLSPDAKPSSPTKDVSPLVISTKADKPKDISSVPIQSHKPSEAAIMKIKVEKDTAVTTESKTTATKCEDTALSSTVQATTASLKTALSKRPLTSNILGFSSPSVVASMITDMDTPLSSSLSSEESSSCQETPEKKEDNPAKVQLSAAGSAFTKVIPDATKHPPTENKEQAEKSQKALSFSAKPAPTPPTDSTTSFKPIETKASEDVAADKEGDTHPVVAPVLADSYLSTLQHKLAEKGAKKTPTPPAGETSAEKESQRPVNTELYRPVFYGTVESKKEKEHKLDETISPT